MPETSSLAPEVLEKGKILHDNTSAERRVSQFGFLVGIPLIALYFVAAIYISRHRLFWYDEIITFKLSTLPTTNGLFLALLRSADTMTPAYLLLERLFLWMLPNPEVASRLPSAIALSLGYLAVFDIGRRLTNSTGGLLALTILLNSFLPSYAFEARAYSFYFLASSLALWVWLFAKPRLSLILVAVCFFAGEMLHYYFAFCIVPYACYEIFQMARQRRLMKPSPKLIGGLLGIASSALLMFPFVNAVRQLSKGFWAVPFFGTLIQTYSDYFPNAALLLGLFFVWLMLIPRLDKAIPYCETSEPERLGWFFLLIPIAGFVLAKLVTNAFYHRYFIGLLPGVAVAASCLVQRLLSQRKLAAMGVAVLFVSVAVHTELRNIKHPETVDPGDQRLKTRAVLGLERGLFQEGKKYLVPSDPLLFTELSYYSTRPSSVMLFADLNTSPAKRFESHLATILDSFWPQPLWNLADLERHANESALINPNEELISALLTRGYRLDLRYTEPVQVIYPTR